MAGYQVNIVRGHNVYLVLHDAVDDAVIGIGALVIALQPFKAGVARDAQGDAVARAQLLQLGHDAVGDDGRGLGIEAIHHCLDQL